MTYRLPTRRRRPDRTVAPKVPEAILLPLVLSVAERDGPDGALPEQALADLRRDVSLLPATGLRIEKLGTDFVWRPQERVHHPYELWRNHHISLGDSDSQTNRVVRLRAALPNRRRQRLALCLGLAAVNGRGPYSTWEVAYLRLPCRPCLSCPPFRPLTCSVPQGAGGTRL